MLEADGDGDIARADLVQRAGQCLGQPLRLPANFRADEKEEGGKQAKKQQVDDGNGNTPAASPAFHPRDGWINQVSKEDGE